MHTLATMLRVFKRWLLHRLVVSGSSSFQLTAVTTVKLLLNGTLQIRWRRTTRWCFFMSSSPLSLFSLEVSPLNRSLPGKCKGACGLVKRCLNTMQRCARMLLYHIQLHCMRIHHLVMRLWLPQQSTMSAWLSCHPGVRVRCGGQHLGVWVITQFTTRMFQFWWYLQPIAGRFPFPLSLMILKSYNST